MCRNYQWLILHNYSGDKIEEKLFDHTRCFTVGCWKVSVRTRAKQAKRPRWLLMALLSFPSHTIIR
jgi:hypothetical protein